MLKPPPIFDEDDFNPGDTLAARLREIDARMYDDVLAATGVDLSQSRMWWIEPEGQVKPLGDKFPDVAIEAFFGAEVCAIDASCCDTPARFYFIARASCRCMAVNSVASVWIRDQRKMDLEDLPTAAEFHESDAFERDMSFCLHGPVLLWLGPLPSGLPRAPGWRSRADH